MLLLPAASCAVTVKRFEPGCSAIPATLHAPVPEAAPLAPLLLAQVTCVTPTLSVAVPLKLTVPLVVPYVAWLVGVVIVTAGGVVSGVGVPFTGNVMSS